MTTPVASGLGWPTSSVRSTAGLGWPPSAPFDVNAAPRCSSRSVSRETSRHCPSRQPSELVGPVDSPPVERSALRPVTAAEIAAATPSPLPEQPAAAPGTESLQPPSHPPARPRSRSPRVLVVANQKGGVGKTTTAVNVAAALASSGLRVLLIDLDPQGNASTALAVEHGDGCVGTYDVLSGEASFDEVLVECTAIPGLFVVPATLDLAGAEIELVSMPHRESRLREALVLHLAGRPAAATYDFVLIDCPPSLGLLTVNALAAGAELLVPIQCEYYALEGLSQLLRTLNSVRDSVNPRLRVGAIVLTMYDGRTRLAAGVADEVRAHFGPLVLRTAVPRSVRISEAPSYGQTVLTYDPDSVGAQAYRAVAAELISQEALT